jgi:uridine kinase
MSQTLLVGICGGSCSGKTTLGKQLLTAFGGPEKCGLIFQDSYYIDQSSKFNEDGGAVNFDHPSSLDFSLMATHLKALKAGKSVELPIYDYVTHRRKPETQKLDPKKVILIDGTLILSQPEVRSLLDVSIFLDVDEEIRLARRKKRDVSERGRDLNGVIKQFQNHVKPMHDEFVQPSASFATRIEDKFPDAGTLSKLILCF